jgi:DNA-binding HxlR family transcriptional regulator
MNVFYTPDLKIKPYKSCSEKLHTWCADMNHKMVLSEELRNFVESRLRVNLEGIEETLRQIFQVQKLSVEDLKDTMRSLEESFNFLSQKWNLQILYILFLRKVASFSELKRILGVNSRTLSDKLKSLTQGRYINRTVEEGPPLKVRYSLTKHGRDTILLALPFLYYASGYLT